VRSYSGAERVADAEKGTVAAEATNAASTEDVHGVTSVGSVGATELVSKAPESLDLEGAVTSAGVLEPASRTKCEFVFSSNFARFGLQNRGNSENSVESARVSKSGR